MISRDLPAACRRARDLVDQRLEGDLDATCAEELNRHLTACASCRAHQEGTESVVGLLRHCAPQCAASERLTRQLQAIAGDEARAPLWMSAQETGHLPSRRRRRQRLAVAGSMALVATVGMLFTLGLIMAPHVPVVANAPQTGHREHDLRLGIGPGAQAVNAVLASDQQSRLPRSRVIERPQLLTGMQPADISRSDAMELLEGALSPLVAYSGVQRVTLAGRRDHLVADVRVQQKPGHSVAVAVLDRSGQVISSGLLPVRTTPLGVMPPAATTFTRVPGGVIAGHSTELLEAKRSDRSLVARWWLVPELGLVAWNETFDSAGRLVRSAGFTSLAVTSPASSGRTQQVPLQLSSAPAVSAPTRAMCGGGFNCSARLAGFRLVQISTDSPTRPTVVHAVYARGDVWVTVMQQRGRLGSTDGAGYGVSPDRCSLVWQSGDVVYTVTTDAGPSVGARVAADLPHHEPAGSGPISRSWAGLSRLVGR